MPFSSKPCVNLPYYWVHKHMEGDDLVVLQDNEFPWPDATADIRTWRDEPGAAGKTPVRSYMRFGIDIDGTISRAPKHFQRLINALMATGNMVYIVTARDSSRRQETEEFLATLHIQYDWLIMKPVDWPYSIPDFKVQVVLDKDLHMLIDDEEENCWAVEIRTQALAVHMLPTPMVPEEFGSDAIMHVMSWED